MISFYLIVPVHPLLLGSHSLIPPRLSFWMDLQSRGIWTPGLPGVGREKICPLVPPRGGWVGINTTAACLDLHALEQV